MRILPQTGWSQAAGGKQTSTAPEMLQCLRECTFTLVLASSWGERIFPVSWWSAGCRSRGGRRGGLSLFRDLRGHKYSEYY